LQSGLSLKVCHIHDQYKKTPPFQVVFFYIVFGLPVRTREESVFDKEAWRDGSIAEKSRRSGADFFTKNQANLVAVIIKTTMSLSFEIP
jgi:hypothetical protein